MSTSSTAGIQAAVANRLPEIDGYFAGIVGDRPSQSAKSPSIWNPVFKSLGLPVTYLAFDVEPNRLADLVSALRAAEHYIGGNVTMPYKVAIIEHLDDVDEKARAIGAVNTIVRAKDGRLTGYNTDGQGGIDCVTRPQPGHSDPLVGNLTGKRVLLIGAGGAARALAFYVADALGPNGRLHLLNRTSRSAVELAASVHARYGNCTVANDHELEGFDLLINASTVGQLGIRRLTGDRVTCLEPYSPLASCDPPQLSATAAADDRTFYRAWMRHAGPGVSANQTAALAAMVAAPAELAVFDIVFAPLETVLLRHARLTGHRGLNGKGMNIAQAADGFFNRVCRNLLVERELATPDVYDRIVQTMYSVW